MMSETPTTRPGDLKLVPERERTPSTRSTRIFLWVFSVAMVVTAGTAFVFKLVDFFITATSEGPGALASFLIPVMNYLLVATGFAFLFVWAYTRGQFRNVEDPKYRMLELNRLVEQHDKNLAAGETS
jgi:uncharacterized membrane protein